MKIEFDFPKDGSIKKSILPFLSGFLVLSLFSLTIYVFKEIYVGKYTHLVDFIYGVLSNPFAFFLEIISLPKILWGAWKKIPTVVHLVVLFYSIYGVAKVIPMAILKMNQYLYNPNATPNENR